MFKGLKPARRKPCRARRRMRIMFLFPCFENIRRSKRRNHRAHFLTNCRPCSNESRAARSKHPFVRTCRERVAAKGGDLRILHSQTVHAGDDQEHAIFFVATSTHFSKTWRYARDRETYAAAGVHT